MVETILGILEAALSIWDSKEKTRYQDKLMKIKREYREEVSKPIKLRNDAVIDNLKFELRLFSTAVIAAIKAEDIKNKS